jgi:dCMP deaminase
MAKQQDLDIVHMNAAMQYASLSRALRKKVGAVLVTRQGIIVPGFNGTPRGSDNSCEYVGEDDALITKSSVIHAELNCIMKAAREGVSVIDSTIYVTMSPCEPCSAMLIQAGVRRVVFADKYRCTAGLDLLKNSDILIEQLEL